MIDFEALAAPFPESDVHWRVQGQPYERNGRWSAMALAYLDARDVMDRLDDVCTPAGWQNKVAETAKGRVICSIGIKLGDDWIWKSDGAGDTAVEGEKGGISDSLKRAAVCWGIGRYLYRMDAVWVSCEVAQKNGKTYWKKWSEDPWSRVRRAAPATSEGFAPKGSKVRDWFKSNIPLAQTQEQLRDWYDKHSEAKDGLPDPMKLEVEKAYNDAFNKLTADPARQAPQGEYA